MSQFLFYYQRPEPATWVYMSSFLVIALYFMFHRFWSIRNLDLILLILLTPGLMMVYEGRKRAALEVAELDAVSETILPNSSPSSSSAGSIENESSNDGPREPDNSQLDSKVELTASDEESDEEAIDSVGAVAEGSPIWSGKRLQYWGFTWLLSVCGLWIVRLLLDTTMTRRPLLEPNLSSGGMTFIGVSLFIFLMANVLSSPPIYQTIASGKPGPGYDLLKMLPDIQTSPDPEVYVSLNANRTFGEPVSMSNGKIEANSSSESKGPVTRPIDDETSVVTPSISVGAGKSVVMLSRRVVNASRIFLVLANLVLILAIVSIGYWHFENLKTGIGVAALFLLLPYTAQMTGKIDHLVPGALLVLAIAIYRQPVVSGIFLGISAGMVFYPFFLFPLWISFYWQRGRYRFLIGFLSSVVGMVVALGLVTRGMMIQGIVSDGGFWGRLGQMFGTIPFALEGLDGIWGLGWHPYFRIPVMVAFVLLSFSFVFWPAQKSLATLLGCTAAIMTAAQFCYAYGGGLYMAWFLPTALLTVFRPNLDDCIALNVVRSMGKKSTRQSNKQSDAPAQSMTLTD